MAFGTRVHVLFINKDRHTIGKFMNHATYDAIPLMEVATPEDYARYGELTEAASQYEWPDKETVRQKAVKAWNQYAETTV